MMVKPPCRFCGGKLESGGCETGGNYHYTRYIYHCKPCLSQQKYKYEGEPLEFSFEYQLEKYHYHITFNQVTMRMYVARVTTFPYEFEWKGCLDIHLSEFPAWLRPGNVTEDRIKTMMVFS